MHKTDNTPNRSFARSEAARCAYCDKPVASYCVGKNLAGEDVHVCPHHIGPLHEKERQEQQARKNGNGSTNAAPRIAETAAIVAAPPVPFPAAPPIAPAIPRDEKPTPRKGNAGPYVDWDHPDGVYLYRDASGKVLYRNARYAVMAADGSPHINPRGKPDKEFAQYHLNGSGEWEEGRNYPDIPYLLPELIGARAADRTAAVYVVSGEHSAELLKDWGLTAISITGRESDDYALYLADADVIIVPDNDRGRQACYDIAARKITKHAASVRVLTLPALGEWEALEDWHAHGGTREQFLELIDAACGWVDPHAWGRSLWEAARTKGAESFDDDPTSEVEQEDRPFNLFSRTTFLSNFQPPEYVVDGLMQRGFVYSMTGPTGAGKTAIALLLIQAIASAKPDPKFGPLAVEKGNVVYFSGENSDDIRMRIVGADALRTDNPTEDRTYFVDGVFDINEIRNELERVITEIDGVSLVVIDTSAAFFLGQDENANPQMGEHARMLRSLTKIPGNPCVLVLCHPIKHATVKDQLLPRGGGAFLAEVDGNFTCWRNPSSGLVELHWAGKLRGPEFEPMLFQMETFTTDALTDHKGRLLPTVRAVHVGDAEEEARAEHASEEENKVLIAMLREPGISVAKMAIRCGWMSRPDAEDGKDAKPQPQKSKVDRILTRLKNIAKPALTKQDRGKWALTEKGEEAAKKIAAALGNRKRLMRIDRAPEPLACRSTAPGTARANFGSKRLFAAPFRYNVEHLER